MKVVFDLDNTIVDYIYVFIEMQKSFGMSLLVSHTKKTLKV